MVSMESSRVFTSLRKTHFIDFLCRWKEIWFQKRFSDQKLSCNVLVKQELKKQIQLKAIRFLNNQKVNPQVG